MAPVFLLIVFGSIEASRVNSLNNAIQNACFEGARRGITPGATAQQCRLAATELLEMAKVTEFTVTTTPATISALDNEVTVSIEVPVNAANGFGVAGFITGKTIGGSAKLPIQRTK